MSNLCGSLRCDVVIWLEAKRLGRGEGVAEKFVSLTKSQPAGTAQTSAALVASQFPPLQRPTCEPWFGRHQDPKRTLAGKILCGYLMEHQHSDERS